MAKATFTSQKGTVVNIDGTPAEIQTFLNMYEATTQKEKIPHTKAKNNKIDRKDVRSNGENHLLKIIKSIVDCDEAEGIEKNIIDRNSQLERVLLPLFIVNEYMNNEVGLQPGEISKITAQLGVRIQRPNVSNILSKTASRYVMGDRVRKPGATRQVQVESEGIEIH